MVRADICLFYYPVWCFGHCLEPPAALFWLSDQPEMATRRLPVQELEQRNVAGNSLLSSRYLSRRQRYLIVCNAGIFLTDHDATTFDDSTVVFLNGVDWRNIRGIAITPQGDLFAAAQFGLYRYKPKGRMASSQAYLCKREKNYRTSLRTVTPW